MFDAHMKRTFFFEGHVLQFRSISGLRKKEGLGFETRLEKNH